MKKFVFAIAAISLLAGVMLAAGYGRHMMVPYNWDASKIRVFKGEISNIVSPPMMYRFKAEGKEYILHLGPAYILRQKGLSLNKGDRLTVKGMVVNVNDIYHLMASEVEKGNLKVQLRGENGYPLWMGHGRMRGYGCRGMMGGQMQNPKK